MKDKKTEGQKTDKEMVTPNEEVKDQINEQLEDESSADNMTDESYESNDNSAKLAEDIAMWQDKYTRLSAEFDNYRKRTLKEKMELIETGGEKVIKTVLGVLDDIDRAVIAVDKSDDIVSARTGFKLIQQKMIDTLKQNDVVEIVSIDADLDTDLHEAVAKFPSENKKGKILDVVQKGYKLKDKVIRFSKVVVGE